MAVISPEATRCQETLGFWFPLLSEYGGRRETKVRSPTTPTKTPSANGACEWRLCVALDGSCQAPQDDYELMASACGESTFQDVVLPVNQAPPGPATIPLAVYEPRSRVNFSGVTAGSDQLWQLSETKCPEPWAYLMHQESYVQRNLDSGRLASGLCLIHITCLSPLTLNGDRQSSVLSNTRAPPQAVPSTGIQRTSAGFQWMHWPSAVVRQTDRPICRRPPDAREHPENLFIFWYRSNINIEYEELFRQSIKLSIKFHRSPPDFVYSSAIIQQISAPYPVPSTGFVKTSTGIQWIVPQNPLPSAGLHLKIQRKTSDFAATSNGWHWILPRLPPSSAGLCPKIHQKTSEYCHDFQRMALEFATTSIAVQWIVPQNPPLSAGLHLKIRRKTLDFTETSSGGCWILLQHPSSSTGLPLNIQRTTSDFGATSSGVRWKF
ncbi:hypothetical protein FB451DRAFT_1374741 [Mycena latifolia]|nr:hypothetical protein FB451DRAFT_1374741 [Mycena latifolia]